VKITWQITDGNKTTFVGIWIGHISAVSIVRKMYINTSVNKSSLIAIK